MGTTNKKKYSQKISGMLASLTAFLCTALIFFNAEIITLSTLLHALSIIVPATLIVGYLGFQIGKIFDSTKKKNKLNRFIK